MFQVIFGLSVIFDIIWIIASLGAALLGTLIFHLIVSVIFTLLSLLLIVAVKRENSAQVYRWTYLSLFVIILNIIAFIVSIIIMFLATFGTGVIVTIWYIYCVLVVNSYYRGMDGGPVNY